MNDQNRENAELILSGRLYLYTLLHRFFGAEPDGALLELLVSGNTQQSFALFSLKEGDEADQAVSYLKRLEEMPDKDTFLNAAKEEYTRLFIGPAALVAPPWESV